MKPSVKIIFKTVDEYFSTLSGDSLQKMEVLRNIIRQEVPEAVEAISYNMPAFRYKGILCYYAAHREHIGFYPSSVEVLTAFKGELAGYKTSKGTVQFPLGKEIPEELVRKIIRYRMDQKTGGRT